MFFLPIQPLTLQPGSPLAPASILVSLQSNSLSMRQRPQWLDLFACLRGARRCLSGPYEVIPHPTTQDWSTWGH